MTSFLLSALLLAAPADPVLCDFDTVTVPWRSKFDGHEVAATTRDGQPTQALRFRFDLRRQPSYDWVRAKIEADVRPFQYVSFRTRGDTGGVKLIPMLIQLVPPGPGQAGGELVASAPARTLAPTGDNWQTWSLPLSAFTKLSAVAPRVDYLNFSLTADQGPVAAEVWFDDLVLCTAPRGTVVPEAVPYPPADIAVTDEAAFFSLLDLTQPALTAVRQAVEARDWAAAKQAWRDHLANRTAPRWTWSRRDRERILAAYNPAGGGVAGAIREADRVLSRSFNFLGVPKQLESNVVWLQGPSEWTHVLSRFGYWKPLALAWWHTGDDRYPRDLVALLRDWVADNPVPRLVTNDRGDQGSVWRTLETGIRGDCWFDVLELLLESPAFDAAACYDLTRSLVEHARHLHRYETTYRAGNFQVVECTGVACIGLMLPEFREAAAWRERAFQYLVQHMTQDVYPDGGHHELTPGYHSWVMERFLKVALLGRLNGYEVPGLLDRHERMFEFLLALSRPDGTYPSLGDAGRGGSSRSWLGVGALLYQRPDLRWLGPDQVEAGWYWMFGADELAKYPDLARREPATSCSVLPDSGYVTMRAAWVPNAPTVLFDAAPWGGGHSHQDRLQVQLWAGRDLVIDSGQISYDQPESRALRGAEAHNVLLIGGPQQPTGDPRLLLVKPSPQADFACGEIESVPPGVRHRRSVLFAKPDFVLVVDHVYGDGEQDLTRLFHLPLGTAEHDAEAAWTTFPTGANVAVMGLDGTPLAMRQALVAAGSATVQEAPLVALAGRRSLPAVLAALLVPLQPGAARPRVEALPDQPALVAGYRLIWPDGRRDEVRVAAEPVALPGAEQPVRALLERVDAAGGRSRVSVP